MILQGLKLLYKSRQETKTINQPKRVYWKLPQKG